VVLAVEGQQTTPQAHLQVGTEVMVDMDRVVLVVGDHIMVLEVPVAVVVMV
jgi:hypothetical protein